MRLAIELLHYWNCRSVFATKSEDALGVRLYLHRRFSKFKGGCGHSRPRTRKPTPATLRQKHLHMKTGMSEKLHCIFQTEMPCSLRNASIADSWLRSASRCLSIHPGKNSIA